MNVFIQKSNAISGQGQKTEDPTLSSAKIMTEFKAKGIPPMKLRRMDRASRMVCTTLMPLLESVEEPEKWGLFLGTYSAGSDAVEGFLEKYLREGPLGANPMLFPNTVLNAPAGQAAIFFQLKGPNSMACQNWLSGLAAIQAASQHIQCHPEQSMFAGGVDIVAPFQLMVWKSHPAYGSHFQLGEACAAFSMNSKGGTHQIIGFTQGRNPKHRAFEFVSMEAQQIFLEKHWAKYGTPNVLYATTPQQLELAKGIKIIDLSPEIGVSATTPLVHLHHALQSSTYSCDILAGGLAGETLILRVQKV